MILPALEKLLLRFREPAIIMKKRQAKLLDYERVQEMKKNGEVPDKALVESADAYMSINDQVKEELPVFLSLVSEYIYSIMLQLHQIQSSLYETLWHNIHHLSEDLNLNMTTQEIPKEFECTQVVECRQH